MPQWTVDFAFDIRRIDAPATLDSLFSRPKERRLSIKREYLWPTLVICAGVAASAGVYWYVDHKEQEHLAEEFALIAQRDVDRISNRFKEVLSRLMATRQLYAASTAVDRGEFEAFVSGLVPAPGVLAYEWIARVPHGEREKFEAATIKDGAPGFAIRESRELVAAAPRDEYFPVTFVSPLKGNERAVGFDLASNPSRLDAIVTGRDSGLLAVTRPIVLVQETGNAVGLLALLPHYRNGAPRGTVAERRENLEGFLLAVLRPKDLLDGVVGSRGGDPVGLNVELRYVGAGDGPKSGNASPAPVEQPVLCSHHSRAAAHGFTLAHLDSATTFRRNIEATPGVGGNDAFAQAIEVVITPSPAFAMLHATGVPAVALSGLLGADALLIVLVVLTTRQRTLRNATVALELQLERERTGAAVAASQTKSNFLAAMSHEIRTPMNGVIGMVDVLMQTSLKVNQMEMAKTIRISAFSLLAIINEILDFSKVEAGKLELSSEPMSLERVVEGSCLMLESIASKKGHDLTMFIDPRIPRMVEGDPLRIQQVLVNLLGNALKFTSGTERHGRIWVRCELTEELPNRWWVEISVRDNGIGMDEGVQERLFEPFRQAEFHTTKRYGGTGLGLTISKQIVELMGGSIRFESVLGSGSTFTARLPFSRVEQSAAAPPLMLENVTCKVIGVDTELAHGVASYLRSAGATVTSEANAVGNHNVDLCCWIIDFDESITLEMARDRIRALAGDYLSAGKRFLVIMRGTGRTPRYISPEFLQVSGDLLTRESVVNAVALLTGRIDESGAGLTPHTSTQVSSTTQRSQSVPLGCEGLVLVAEDNEINQEVIRRQMALLGYAIDLVGTGKHAFERWQKGDYSLVVTDIHMPEMDGYQLAQAIRAAEGSTGRRRTPIIALTANALKGEADNCKAVGMDDYISKPVVLADLKCILEKWTHSAGSAQSRATTSVAQNQSCPVDVRVLVGQVGEDPTRVTALLGEFRVRGGVIVGEIEVAAHHQRLSEAGALGHKLKSSALSVGAKQLGEICATIEAAGKSNNREQVSIGVAALLAEWTLVDLFLQSRT